MNKLESFKEEIKPPQVIICLKILNVEKNADYKEH